MSTTVTSTVLIGVLESSTQNVSFVIFRSEDPDPIVEHTVDLRQFHPEEGWVEQDPNDILKNLDECVRSCASKLSSKGHNIKDIKTLGITNQRETTVVWDRKTGDPLYNTICWSDNRTETTAAEIISHVPENDKNFFKSYCGLPISPYFSALKLKWLRDNIKEVDEAYQNGRMLFGTVDTWILWNITGGVNGGVHATDVTNASRTMLMNLDTLDWDPTLKHFFRIRDYILPEIRSCSELYGKVKDWSLLDKIPITGVMGNQQSALVGQKCLTPGLAKNSYRSGCFLLYNSGSRKIYSQALLTTVAYQMGPTAKPVYALEGDVATGGSCLQWLKQNMGMISDQIMGDSDLPENQVTSTGGAYFVPAFKGLFAPYWRPDARGTICGLTQFTNRSHIIRAALESICYETRDILETMRKHCGLSLSRLYVDGFMTRNTLLMQMQADIIGIPIVIGPKEDMTSIGVAIAAGKAKGFWKIDLEAHYHENTEEENAILPKITNEERDAKYKKWKMAIVRAQSWVSTKERLAMPEERYRLLASIPASLFLISTFGILRLSEELQK